MDVDLYFAGKTITTSNNCKVISIKYNPHQYYLLSGVVINPSGSTIIIQWDKDGFSQLPEMRKAGLYEYDTPHYDLSEDSILLINKKIRSLCSKYS